MDQDHFNLIKKNFGYCASWAVWSNESDKPKSNVGDLSILDPLINKNLFSILKTDIVFVGLNFSHEKEMKAFANFHDDRPQSQDYKIRFALQNTRFWGAYMTDIIKSFPEKSSEKMMVYLKNNKQFEIENCKLFLEEMNLLKTENIKIIAFGNDAYSIIKKNFKDKFKIVKAKHYASYINREEYRKFFENLDF
jgi:hypothetical protein